MNGLKYRVRLYVNRWTFSMVPLLERNVIGRGRYKYPDFQIIDFRNNFRDGKHWVRTADVFSHFCKRKYFLLSWLMMEGLQT